MLASSVPARIAEMQLEKIRHNRHGDVVGASGTLSRSVVSCTVEQLHGSKASRSLIEAALNRYASRGAVKRGALGRNLGGLEPAGLFDASHEALVNIVQNVLPRKKSPRIGRCSVECAVTNRIGIELALHEQSQGSYSWARIAISLFIGFCFIYWPVRL